ncbi:LysE family translocator [Agilicoccus flavus]|uniref:LysE family translocator n=1 Tax=Agilicoccus flavus TaxID=2775968 RepID=UPI001CF7025E|nr:LysE family translocator [Agilicoccus flavus]
MVDVGVLPAFVAVILLFLLPPGPDMAYMIATGLAGGRRAAVRGVLGIGTGMAVYAVAVAVGVGSVTRSHPLILDGVKVCGALYLARLAYVTVRDAGRRGGDSSPPPTARPYVRGVVVSLANPKLILVFLAVLPQFVGDARSLGAQLAMLGAVNVLMEVTLYGGIGVLAGTFHTRFRGSRSAGVVLDYAAAAVYAVLAGVVAVDSLAAVLP